MIIDKLLKEPIAHHLCDSGGAYGYIYERNQTEGYPKGDQYVDEWTDEDCEERTLDVTIPVFDYLTYNLEKDRGTEAFEKELFEAFKENGFEPYEIYEVEDYLKNDGAEVFGIEPTGITNISYVNTYNYEEYLSQTLLYVTFSRNGDDYLLLEVHNGCDVRSGYTYPQLFKLYDIEYFLIGQDDRRCYCDCGYNNYWLTGSSDISDKNGAWLDKKDIYNRTYVDGNYVRCCECDGVLQGGFVEW